jgi:hypothetical protein
MLFGGADDVEFKLTDQLAVDFYQCKIGLDALSDGEVGEVLGDAHPVALAGQISTEGEDDPLVRS